MSTLDREKYKKYKALSIQLNGKYLKHKSVSDSLRQENNSLRQELNNLRQMLNTQNGGAKFSGSHISNVPQHIDHGVDSVMPDIASEEFKRVGLFDSE